MSSYAAIRSQVRANAAVQASEYDDTTLDAWIVAALYQHNFNYSVATIPDKEVEGVVILTWIKICYSRASKYSLSYGISGMGGSINKGEIVTHQLELLRELREEYIKFCQRVGVNPAPLILVNDFTKFDTRLQSDTPVSANAAPESTVLSTSNYTGDKIDLSWKQAVPPWTFLRYKLWYGTQAGLKDMTTVGDEDAPYNGVDTDKATLLKEYTDIWRCQVRLSGLSITQAYYFVVVVEDVNGLFSVSNEVSTVGTQPPAEMTDNFQWYIDPTTGKQCLRIVNDEGEVLEEIKPAGVP